MTSPQGVQQPSPQSASQLDIKTQLTLILQHWGRNVQLCVECSCLFHIFPRIKYLCLGSLILHEKLSGMDRDGGN